MDEVFRRMKTGGTNAVNQMTNEIFGSGTPPGTGMGRADTTYHADLFTPSNLLLLVVLVVLFICTVRLWNKWKSDRSKQTYKPNPYVGRRI